MNRKSRRLWKSFTKFARTHELKHRQIYLECARNFAASAKYTPKTASCSELKERVRQRLNSTINACEVQHRALDRNEGPRLKRLPLLRAASVR